jgi:hypothetical protein
VCDYGENTESIKGDNELHHVFYIILYVTGWRLFAASPTRAKYEHGNVWRDTG